LAVSASERPERRAHRRYSVWFPVQLDGEELGTAVGISKDVSVRGLRLEANGRLPVGALVQITFRVSLHQPARQVEATVVRAETNALGVWPWCVALEFDEPLADIETALRREARLQARS
jgi:hypothetical protein